MTTPFRCTLAASVQRGLFSTQPGGGTTDQPIPPDPGTGGAMSGGGGTTDPGATSAAPAKPSKTPLIVGGSIALALLGAVLLKR